MAYMGAGLDGYITGRVGTPATFRSIRAPGTPEHYAGEHATEDPLPGFTERDGLWIPDEAFRPPDEVRYGSQQHPRGIGYDMGAVSRIRKIALEHPGWVATGWSALAGWGLTYFCDDADTCVLSGGRPRLASHRGDVTRRRNQGVHAGVTVYRPDPWCPELMMVPPVLALADCLRSLARGEHRWNVLPGTGLPDSEVRVVQLIDAVSQVFDVPPGAWPDACLNQTDTARLRRLVKLCDQGAESPMETMMRLLVGRLFPGFISQLVVHGDGSVSDPVHGGDAGAGRIVARLDLGHPGLKLALQYDGSAHLAAGRRDRDSLVNTSLANLGWHVLRVTHGHLRDLDLLAETLQDGIRICRGRSAPRS